MKNWQPIDRVALPLIIILTIIGGLLLIRGDQTIPKVRNFSWDRKQLNRYDQVFSLTFNRPMYRESVEANLKIKPDLPGKISWVNQQKLVYSLTAPWRYHTDYVLQIKDAYSNVGEGKKGNLMQPFTSRFKTRDRILAYRGVIGEQKGRLVLYNFTKNKFTILTPPNLIVQGFKPYPNGDQILFSATDKSAYDLGVMQGYLYNITTGISDNLTNNSPGIITSILTDYHYENTKFDLSPDGQIIVVQRVNLNHIKDFGLWVLRANQAPEKISDRPGGDFLIMPDSETIASLQSSDGVVILPLKKTAKPLNFLPSFSRVLNFSTDGTKGAMVKYNNGDNTQVLFLVNNQGEQTPVISTKGEIFNCQFSPLKPVIYCLITRQDKLLKNAEKLTIEAINLSNYQESYLLNLPYQWGMNLSLSPDGNALLFDRIIPKKTEANKQDLKTETGISIDTAEIMFLSLENNQKMVPQKLPLAGYDPQWLP